MLDKSTKWVNQIVLKNLREKVSLTREQVEEISKKLKRHYFEPLSAHQLVEWEEGRGEPELLHLETLSEIYHCPVGYFFLDRMPEEKIPISNRGLSQEKKLSYQSYCSLQRFYELANFIVSLIERLSIPWEVKIHPNEINQNSIHLDEIVREKRNYFAWETVRKELGNNLEDAFKWWREKIESLGIFCFELKLEPKEVRGASLWLKSYPFILVNHQDTESSAGRIFTLLHEYIHLISAEEGVLCDFRGIKKGQNPEPFANKFAARMLLTYEELRAHLRSFSLFKYQDQWSDKIIDEIRKPFFVSRDVIAIMLQEMQIAPDNLYDQKIMEWEGRKIWGRGKRPSRKEQKLRELGRSFTNLLANRFNDPSFPVLDASYILNMKVEKANEFIKWVHEKA
jgi:Zn-dependent peptidase ImmA (M78 family)